MAALRSRPYEEVRDALRVRLQPPVGSTRDDDAAAAGAAADDAAADGAAADDAAADSAATDSAAADSAATDSAATDSAAADSAATDSADTDSADTDHADAFVDRVDLEGTTTSLVFDLPEAAVNVSREEAEGWGKPDDELFAAAFANVRTLNPLPEARVEELEGPPLWIYEGDEYVTAHALTLHEQPALAGPGGTAFGVPDRHVLVAAPLPEAGGSPPPIVAHLATTTAILHQQAAHPVCPHVFLRTPDGRITLAPLADLATDSAADLDAY
jgi:hypothetical protein